MTILEKTKNATIFSKEIFKNFAVMQNDEKWLAEKRQTAWHIFEDTPMPTTSDEPWRRTNIKRIKWENYTLNLAPSLSPVENLADLPDTVQKMLSADKPAAGRLLFVNGQLIYAEIDADVAAQGVIFTDLRTATQKHTDLVSAHLMDKAVPPSDSKFAALNGALWQNGGFLFVPKNVIIEKPFQVAILLDGDGATSIHRSLIIAEESSQSDYIEETASLNDASAGLSVGAVEIIARPNANIRYVDLQQWGHKVVNFNTKRAIAHEDSNVYWDLGELGSQLTKTFIDTQLIGSGANTECNGVYFLDESQHVDLDTMMHHAAYSTTGDLLLHGALKDKARAIFIGMIKIDPAGQLTDSYLKNQNLLLDDTCRADSIPSLEIDANDVRASHAATISQVEEEYVFYLQSRGIPRKIAVQMIVEGFFETVFARMGNERVREHLMEAVSQKMTQRI